MRTEAFGHPNRERARSDPRGRPISKPGTVHTHPSERSA